MCLTVLLSRNVEWNIYRKQTDETGNYICRRFLVYTKVESPFNVSCLETWASKLQDREYIIIRFKSRKEQVEKKENNK